MPTRSIPWPRILAEGVVIIASILLALAAESWWQERSDRAEEEILLSALQQEFHDNDRYVRTQADSLAMGVALLDSVASLTEAQLAQALALDEELRISIEVQRLRTVALRVGALDDILGTEKATLIQSHELRAELAQYQAVRGELDEIGVLLGAVSVDAFVAFNLFPENHRELVALLRSKLGFWFGYRVTLEQLLAQGQLVSMMIEEQLRGT